MSDLDTMSKKELVEEYVSCNADLQEMIDNYMPVAMRQIRQETGRQLTAEGRERVEEALREAMNEAKEEYLIPTMMKVSESALRETIEYLRSDASKELRKVRDDSLEEMMEVMLEKFQQTIPAFTESLEEDSVYVN